MAYSLGETLKDLRNSRGLSQDDLAEKLNDKFGSVINKGMISKWENDLGEPRLEHARILSLFFNIKLDKLLGIDNSLDLLEDETTIAAHHDGEDWSEQELEELRRFKEFIKMKRDNHKQ